jgi:hypothetical protein
MGQGRIVIMPPYARTRACGCFSVLALTQLDDRGNSPQGIYTFTWPLPPLKFGTQQISWMVPVVRHKLLGVSSGPMGSARS